MGNTIGEGINTAVKFAKGFIETFNWSSTGKAVADTINGFLETTDWGECAKTISNGIAGALESGKTILEEIDWEEFANSIKEFVANVDWAGIVSNLFGIIGAAIGGILKTIWTWITEAFTKEAGEYEEIFTYFKDMGYNVIEWFLLGIVYKIGEDFSTAGTWIHENILKPFVDNFKKAFGINSPSTVFYELGTYITEGLCNGIKSLVNTITQIWENIKNAAMTVWNAITSTISNAINGIKNTIQNVLNTIKTIWNNIWNGLKTTVSNIFNGIWNTIKHIINSILGGIEGMANGVVNGVNAVIRALNNLSFDIPDWVPAFGGNKFGFNIPLLGQISLPRLAKGAVLKVPTIAEMAEYPGASTNPEIVTPQNIMEETFDRVLAKYQDNDNTPIYLTVNVGNNKLGQILLDDLRNMKRRSGKDIEALVN